MSFIKKISMPILLSLISVNAMAASSIFIDQLDGNFDASRYLSENAYGFLPVPIIITDPAVSGGLGLMGLFFHEDKQEMTTRVKAMEKKGKDAAKTLMPPSVSAAFGAYTGNGSYLAGGGHLGFFKKGTIRYMGGAGYGNLTLDFYGFGDVTLPKPIGVNTKATIVMQTLKFKLGDSNFFLGPVQRYINADISPSNSSDITPGIPISEQIDFNTLLTTNTVTSGAGLTLEYDSRDNFFSPRDGLMYELNYLIYDEKIGSDIDFNLMEFTALNYFKLTEHWRTNIRVEVDYVDSNRILPPYATPYISMRGIPSARYQGQAVAVTEFEVAYQFNLRWEVNAFAGVGKASDSFSDFSDSDSRVSKGVGFRYLIARRYGFDMGIDIAKGPEDTVFYIQAGSAW